MSVWIFFGKVLPEREPLTWGKPLIGTGAQRNLEVAFDFKVNIRASQAIVELGVTKGNPELASMRHIAANCVRTITDLIGYEHGCCFDVEIVSAICKETSDCVVFGNEIPVLSKRRKEQVPRALDGTLVDAVCRDVPAQMILADFREAMRIPMGTGFFCYRAIEAMMQSMKEVPEEDDASAWQKLRDKLGLDRSVIDIVKRHADFPRHGKPARITNAERAEVFGITDRIIARFLAYLVRGKIPLLVDDFPLLKQI